MTAGAMPASVAVTTETAAASERIETRIVRASDEWMCKECVLRRNLAIGRTRDSASVGEKVGRLEVECESIQIGRAKSC